MILALASALVPGATGHAESPNRRQSEPNYLQHVSENALDLTDGNSVNSHPLRA